MQAPPPLPRSSFTRRHLVSALYVVIPRCRRPVDWDKLEADLRKEEKDEKLDGDAGLQKLFQSIYAGADEVRLHATTRHRRVLQNARNLCGRPKGVFPTLRTSREGPLS